MTDLLLLIGAIVLAFLAIAVASVEMRLREVCSHLKTIAKELKYHDDYTEEELNNAK